MTKLRSPGWNPDAVPVAQRTQTEALALAQHVAKLAAEQPNQFERLAKEYSDDIVTRERGGSLGGAPAGQLPPEFLDALATMKPGDVSRVVPTAFGFHVLMRRAPAPHENVAGKRIVVRYRNSRHASWSRRSREDARAQVERVAQLAKSGKHTFDELVADYSESADKVQGGDLGVYSLRAPEFLPREIERLGELQVGEVSEPLDSYQGFTLLLRTPVTPRQRFAMQALRVNFEPDVADGRPRSRAAAAREAALFAKELRASPADFEAIIGEQCCSDLIQWTDGRGPLGVMAVLKDLRFGEIASEPVLSDGAYLVPKRLDPATVPEPLAPMYELPTPAHPDLDKIVQNTDPAALADGVRRLREHVKRIDVGTKQADLARSLDSLAASFEAVPNLEARKLDIWRTALERIRGTLGPQYFERFQATLNAWVSEQVTAGRP